MAAVVGAPGSWLHRDHPAAGSRRIDVSIERFGSDLRPARTVSTLGAIDTSLRGVRVYADGALPVGSLLSLDFLVPDTPPVTGTAEVVWVEELAPTAPARFDLGLRFLQLDSDVLKLLFHILGSENHWEPR